jgi:hypothetical protein
VLLPKLIDLILWQITQVIPFALITPNILATAEEPHAAGSDDASGLEGSAGRDSRDVIWPVTVGKDEGRDDTAERAAVYILKSSRQCRKMPGASFCRR